MLHLPPTNLLLLAAKQEPYKKSLSLNENIEEISGQSLQEEPAAEKDKTESLCCWR